MNLMTIEWQNRGINLWTIDEGTISLTNGTAQYLSPPIPLTYSNKLSVRVVAQRSRT